MRIRKLELHGFKSFPDKTALHFGSGVACVVGPNGCGKSNIVDAIKWCVGEQSAKSLRGDDMLDVIFAGSAERHPVGYAEVGITFSAEGGEPLPGEYARFSEVQIGRRLHRNGTSEYFINQARVRRKDVVDLLLDTGVGNNLYSFIEQGRIGEIIHTSPEKRRSLIDEAAGITRYKARRDEAQQQLEATGAQLDRAADVADEMGRRVRVLESQVLKVARHRRLRALIRQDEIVLSLAKFADLAASRRTVHDRHQAARLEAGQTDRMASLREVELENQRSESDLAEHWLGVTREELLSSENQVRDLESNRTFSQRTTDEARLEQERVEIARAEADREATKAAADAQRMREELLQLSVAAEEIAEAVAASKDALAGILERRKSEKTAVENQELASSQLSEAHAEARARLFELERRMASIPTLRTRLREQLSEAESEQAALQAEKVRFDGVRAELQGKLVQVEEGVRESDRAVRECDEVVRSAKLSLEAVEKDYESCLRSARDVQEAVAREISELEREVRQKEVERERAMAEAVRSVRQRSESVLEAERRRLRDEVQHAERRGNAWLQALEQVHRESLRQEEARAAAQEAAQEAESASQLSRLEFENSEELKNLEGRLRGEMAERLNVRALARTAAQREVDEAALAWETTHERQLAVRREIEECQGRLRGLEAEALAESSREIGAAAVREVLGSPPSLVDTLDVPEADEHWIGKVLDDRLLAPVVNRRADVELAASTARAKGRATIVWSPGDAGIVGMLKGYAVVESLERAMDHYLSGAGAAVVRDTGERVDLDGVIRLGAAGAAAEAALRRRRDMADLRRLVEEKVATERSFAEELVRLRERRGEAARELENANVQFREEETAGSEQLRATQAKAQASARERVVQKAEEIRLQRAQLRSGLQMHLDAVRSGHDGERQAANKTFRETLQLWRSTLDELAERARVVAEQEVASERERQAAILEALQQEGRAQIEQRKSHGNERRRVLDEASEGARRRAGDAQAALNEAMEARSLAESARSEAQAQASEAALALTRHDAEIQSVAATLLAVERRIGESVGAIEALEVEQESLRQELVAAMSQAAEALGRRDQALAELKRRQGVLSVVEAEEEVARAKVREDAVQAATLDERARGLLGAAESAVARADEARQRRERADQRLLELSQGIEEASRALADTESALIVALEARERAIAQVEDGKERLSQKRRLVREGELALKEVLDRRDGARKAEGELETELREIHLELEALRERMTERHDVSLPALLDRLEVQSQLTIEPGDGARQGFQVADEVVEPVLPLVLRADDLDDDESVRARVSDLEENRIRLAALGEVNLAAMDEYADITVRHADLVAQRLDLETSVESIRSAIAKMNRTCRDRFREAFDRVNENFQAAYPRLVGGGSARLALTDEEDLLETGVDIFVQPPGKRLQNLSLLSGGEKAMAAIALLLSLFQVKPSPFCLLDEVDAPLDEANGARFNEMLKEMSSISQFIVITHNRKTMEAADTLYGITMPTPGCSRLVSVRMGI